jgi:hypothetical protein
MNTPGAAVQRFLRRLPGVLGRVRIRPPADPVRPFEPITFRLDNTEVELRDDRIIIHLAYDLTGQSEQNHYRRRVMRHPLIATYYGASPEIELHYSMARPVVVSQTA